MPQQNEPLKKGYVRVTPTQVLEDLLSMSETKKMELTTKEVRDYLMLEDTAGVGTFEMIVPELKFKTLNYKGKPYVKITAKPEVLKMKVERRQSVTREEV
jgi:hypothetical protein